jgi:hypothetical protein
MAKSGNFRIYNIKFFGPKTDAYGMPEPFHNYLVTVVPWDVPGAPAESWMASVQVQMSYPVVIFQGPIYRVGDDDGRAKVEAVDRLQLHHSATVNGRVIQAQIDVVTEAAFPKLIEEILQELKTFRDRISGLYSRLLNSALDQKRAASQNAARKKSGDWVRVPEFR